MRGSERHAIAIRQQVVEPIAVFVEESINADFIAGRFFIAGFGVIE
jgi:hypothetical protein